MLDFLQNIDRAISVYIAGAQGVFWDAIMIFISGKYTFIPLYIAVALMFIFKKRYVFKGRSRICSADKRYVMNNIFIAIFMIGVVFLTFAATDWLSHSIIKPLVGRLRPGYDPYIWHLVSTPDGKGGLFGFVSNHAANFMGFATISTLLLKNRTMGIITFVVATLVCFSRIYLARHFFGDVLCGAILGLIVAVIIYFIAKKLLLLFVKS